MRINFIFHRSFPLLACCLLAFAPRAGAASQKPVPVPGYTALPLARGKQNQLLLKLPVDNNSPTMVLDTGSPITCVDEPKAKLFNLVSTAKDGGSPAGVVVNGTRHRIGIAPSLHFGPMEIQNMPVVMIDLGDMNRTLKGRNDRTNDGILGLDTMQALRGVVDCGAGRLLLRSSTTSAALFAADLRRRGWQEIPMKLVDGHLVVSGAVNRIPINFIVDTGSPVSVVDQAFCKAHKITLGDQAFSMRAIHFETGGAKVGKVPSLAIGKLDLGRSLVAVFNVAGLIKGQSSPRALLGARTLMRASAFVDCENLKLYLKVPPPTEDWGF